MPQMIGMKKTLMMIWIYNKTALCTEEFAGHIQRIEHSRLSEHFIVNVNPVHG
jgi:hypothetical protein